MTERPGLDPVIHLEIAGIRFAISPAHAGMKLCLDGDLRRFGVPAGDADVNLLASWGDLSRIDCGVPVFDSGGAWQLGSKGDEYFVRCCAPAFGRAPYEIGRFNRAFTCGEILLHQSYFDMNAQVNPLQYPLDEVMMLHVLSRGRGAEIHACGVVDEEGSGLVFCGHSGAGKTTMAGLWNQRGGAAILSDDRIILRKVEGKFRLYGTPWHGEAEFAEPGHAPLKGIFFLRHGSENALVRKSGAEAAAMLFARTFPTFHDRGGLEFTLGFYQELAEGIPCYELSVVPDSRVIRFLQNHLA